MPIFVTVDSQDNLRYAIKLIQAVSGLFYPVERSLEQLSALHRQLRGSAISPGAASAAYIEMFLTEALQQASFSPWDSEPLSLFFSDGDKEIPALVKFQLQSLKIEINTYAEKVVDQEQRIQALEKAMEKHHALLSSLLSKGCLEEEESSERRPVSLDGSLSVVLEQDGVGPSRSPSASTSESAWREIMSLFPLCKDFDGEADEIVRHAQPRDSQVHFRSAAAALLKEQVSKALSCSVFDVSFFGLKCFLPDDAIKLTLIVNQALAATWHKVVFDRLTIASEQNPSSSSSSSASAANTCSSSEVGEESSSSRGVFSDVRLTSDSNTFRIQGLVQGLPFEIVANSRVDLCLLAFFEEVNSLVGHDHLFKRSLLLIRCWWLYEATSDKFLREYLPDLAIWLMATAVFNQHYALIHTPLQALYLFLSVYSFYDGAHQAITLEGIKNFLPSSNHLDVAVSAADKPLIGSKLFEKYYQVVNVQNANALTELAAMKTINVSERSGFNVIHPFTFASMTLEKLSHRKSEKIMNCFKSAAVKLYAFFRERGGATLASALFPETKKRLCDSALRPDVAPCDQITSFADLELQRSPRDVFDVQVSDLWHNILYCNFLLQAVLSETALLSLCTEVLMEKKMLPVGEVGKMLSELTSINNLSSQLREKFGGLKKFLEKYPEIFFVSKDHPFNPNIALKKFLTPQQVEQVEKGTVTLQSLFKTITPRQQQQQQQQQQQSLVNQKKVNRSIAPPIVPLLDTSSFTYGTSSAMNADDHSQSSVGSDRRPSQHWTPFMSSSSSSSFATSMERARNTPRALPGLQEFVQSSNSSSDSSLKQQDVWMSPFPSSMNAHHQSWPSSQYELEQLGGKRSAARFGNTNSDVAVNNAFFDHRQSSTTSSMIFAQHARPNSWDSALQNAQRQRVPPPPQNASLPSPSPFRSTGNEFTLNTANAVPTFASAAAAASQLRRNNPSNNAHMNHNNNLTFTNSNVNNDRSSFRGSGRLSGPQGLARSSLEEPHGLHHMSPPQNSLHSIFSNNTHNDSSNANIGSLNNVNSSNNPSGRTFPWA